MNSEKVEIPQILLNLDQGFPDSFSKDWSGILLVDRIVFKNSEERPTISSLNMPWKISKGFQNIALDFSGKTSAAGQQQGNMNGSLKIDSFESLEKARLALDIKGSRIPAPFLEFISGRSEIGPLFGQALQLDATANIKNLEGNIHARLTGDNGKIALNANISRGFIHLNEPLVLATQGTHELAREVLGKFAPVFSEMVHSDQPITLTISPENFYLPLGSFRWEDFRVGSAVLEMGKLIFNNAGDVRELLSMLKPAKSEQITIWTTPLYFAIENGVITVYRMDMLIMDRYPIATWGRIDLAQDNVQMVLGVSGTALSQALDIGGLSKDAMIQIPVKGSVSNAKIDTSKATTKIGAMIAQSSRGPEGLVLGTVLDLVNGKEGKVPPPTTNPLPWAGREISNQQGTVSEREPHRVIPGERKDPMKEIQREASNLLKGFFR
jgi:hypothetical protein